MGRTGHRKGRKASGNASKKTEYKVRSKAGRVVLRNLSFDVTEDAVEDLLLQFGDIRDVKLLRRQDGKLVGCGFVQFTRKDDAEKAIENYNGKVFMGRKLKVAWAVPKAEYVAMKIIEKRTKSDESVVKEENSNEEEKLEDSKSKVSKVSKPKKTQIPNKKGRIIIRNLPFKVTEEGFRHHFERFGEVTEATLLRKPDGKLVGCGFIQFKTKQHAIKAIRECSGKELLGRPIICDWALPKTKYLAHLETEEKSETEEGATEIKQEPMSDEEIEIKEEGTSPDDDEVEVKEDDDESSDDDAEIKEEKDGSSDDASEEEEVERKTPRVVSNDVSEGRTVFIKNVPFSATNEDLKQCVQQFGHIFYALICIDPLTEHSKGTAFVKFQTKESAEKCLSAGTELQLNGQTLDVFEALNKDDVQKQNTKDNKKGKDGRHLYLVKEGVIPAGSDAAKGVSVADMDKRLQLEQWKSQILRNLNMFVSNVRLAVHNLPPTWDDAQVRNLFMQHVGKGAVITEARVMRDMRNVDAQGVGKSKELAFVKFTNQEHALQALRSINNNPNIFTKARRPIVAFSIENKAIHKVRQRREQKSRARNPLFNKNNESKLIQGRGVKRKNEDHMEADTTNVGEFVGIAAEPGNKKLRSRFNLRTQSALHTLSVRKDKHNQKMDRKVTQQKNARKQSMKQPQQKPVRRNKEDNDTFNTLVNKYKSKLSSVSNKKKWYD